MQKTKQLPLARKYRPQTFAGLIGQEIITETLQQSIAKDSISQAFLFCGGRGTGKTSCARIFAKAINCQNSINLEPCNSCENCQEIYNGSAIDVTEIDAASHRGIENIRKIRETLSYLPIKCKYKVYIIDEVHMLTLESFNALLKSLEEPPKYVKFILATTHPHKIPPTILSRCQRYNFHNIATEKMNSYLQKIAKLEGIQLEDTALAKIVQSARGALRDALVNLEMVYNFCGNEISEQKVAKILETTSENDLAELFLLIAKKDAASLEKFRSILELGIPSQTFLSDFLSFVHKLSIDKYKEEFSHYSVEVQNMLQKISLYKLQQYFQILLEVEGNTKTSEMATLCIEMGILKLCSLADFANLQDILTELESKKSQFQQKAILEKAKDGLKDDRIESAENNAGLVDKVESSENNTNIVGAVERNIYEKTTYKDESKKDEGKDESAENNAGLVDKVESSENNTNIVGAVEKNTL